MGYYTKFVLDYKRIDSTEISIEDREVLEEKIVKELAKVRPEYFNGDEMFDDLFWDTMKWYDHTKDMTEVSKSFPELLFCLEGWGEESDDIWREYYCGGRNVFCPASIVFPTPNTDYLFGKVKS